MSEVDRLLGELRKTRDEVRLKMHLASMEMKEEWDELEEKWDDFSARAEMRESREGLSRAMTDLGAELKQAYRRFSRALKD